VLLDAAPSTSDFNEVGALDIFSHRRVAQVRNIPGAAQIRVATEHWSGWPNGQPNNDPLFGIPFNLSWYDSNVHGYPPLPRPVIISQEERYYPMRSQLVSNDDVARPQYVWDCMFRRFGGTVYVAVFVYRVNMPGAATAPYRTTIDPSIWNDADRRHPPMPVWLDLRDPSHSEWYANGPWNAPGASNPGPQFIDGTAPSASYNPFNERQSWQEPRQWILDQNMYIHRVLSRTAGPDATQVELTRPVEPVYGWRDTREVFSSGTPFWYYGEPLNGSDVPGLVYENVVTDLWYIPKQVTITINGAETEVTLTPVYVAVREL
jgi:hypothetical protein